MQMFIFKTSVTMKPYNRKNWWIDSHFIGDIRVNAKNVRQALEEYKTVVENKYGIEVSKNALKRKNPMYIDTKDSTKQIGYVITGRTDFQSNNYRWVSQYIELWVEILTISETKF